jgi:GT2 family glycosyltransferase
MSEGRRKCIFVVGMHRSGTSAITRVINLLGADLPNDLMPAIENDNETGFWESISLAEIHDSLFDEMNLNWHSIVPIEEEWFYSEKVRKYEIILTEFLDRHFRQSNLFVIKDPRICRLIPLWLRVLEINSIEPIFILIFRNPLEVAQSLLLRNSIPFEESELLWLRYNLEAEKYTRFENRCFISYQSLLDSLVESIHVIESSLKLEWPNKVEDISSKVSEFIDRNLRHHIIADDMGISNSQLTDWTKVYYQLLLRTQVTNSGDINTKIIDEISTQLHNADKSFGRILSILDRFLKEQESQITSLQSVINEKEYQLIEKDRVLAIEKIDYDKLINSLNELLRRKDDFIEELQDKMNLISADNESKNLDIERLTHKIERISSDLRNRDLQYENLEGIYTKAVERLKDIEVSLSYRIGRFCTFPIRIFYDTLIEPFVVYPNNLKLLWKLFGFIYKYPWKVVNQVNFRLIRNLWITFIRKPQSANDIILYYDRLFSGSLVDAKQVVNYEVVSQDAIKGRVSILVVNYNGLSHLDELFTSIRNQDYPNLEVIFIDNGSSDGSIKYVNNNYSEVKIISLPSNVGFSEANNIGNELASGEFVCLVNNDGVLAPNLISSLYSCIEKDGTIGAVGGKILFWKKFVTFNFSIENGGSLVIDEADMISQLTKYNKLFYSDDVEINEGRFKRIFNGSYIRVPICVGQERIVLNVNNDQNEPFNMSVDTEIKNIGYSGLIVPSEWKNLEFYFGNAFDCDSISYVVNNAGSCIDSFGNVGDIGFGEIDVGQYDNVKDVDALCGAALLIRRSVLENEPIFASHFFAYYEDTELSVRLRNKGYRLVLCPNAIFYHKHASSSGENSAFFRFHVTRNRIFFLALHFSPSIWKDALEKSKTHLNHLLHHYKLNSIYAEETQKYVQLIPEILHDWEINIPRIEDKSFYFRSNYFPRIGVYNNFWTTLGGGEHHACIIASALQNFGPVDLISEIEFSIEDLENQFEVNLMYCRKIIRSAEELHHNRNITGEYDLFINSTYGSDLISYAKKSIYIVSFPFRFSVREEKYDLFLENYLFWANSKYTAHWIKNWWGVGADIFYPSIKLPGKKISWQAKRKIILHVGRFFRHGHNKKQKEILKVFSKLHRENSIRDWKLVLIGQVSNENMDYFLEVKDLARDLPVEIFNNVARGKLLGHYREAAIYVHATGLNEETSINPEMNEHFGISTVEAMSYGCVPIVIDKGGQPEIVEDDLSGYLFSNEQSFEEKLLKCINCFEFDNALFNQFQENAMGRSKMFGRDEFGERVRKAIESMGIDKRADLILD